MSGDKTTMAVKLTIDGHPVEAQPQETILEVSKRTGVADIPTLCYSPQLPPYGSCFVCVVEVEGARTLQPSCATRVRPGMVVKTNTERVRASRKMALELLLSAHWADCKGPCQIGCPAGVDAQGYLALAREGRFLEAVELIKEVNPLPIVCGRICVRACEVVCERQHVDDPVGINFVKRYAAELERGEVFMPTPQPATGKKVAIVGAGPAGLTCAYYLALEGTKPVIFDMWPQPGGMLRYGIPEYRLPKKLLNLEIGTVTRLGAEIHSNRTLGKDFTIDSLKDEYDAVFIAVGAPLGKGMRMEGEEDTEGVLSGLDFLTRVELGNPLRVHGRVVVVGGGNTAIDASRTAFRLDADEVIILYRRTRKEMPADDVEIDAAADEGVKMHFLAVPTKILAENGKLTGIEALRMELGEPDASGRRRPVPIPGSEFTLACDFLFGAIGQGTDLWWADKGDETAAKLERTKWNTFVTDERTMKTNIPGIFAGGDVVTGPTVVIDAIAAGKRAAHGILSYLATGEAQAPPVAFYSTKKLLGEPTPEYYSFVTKKERSTIPEPDPEERKRSWSEAEYGLAKEDVLYETDRCLVCGCLDLGDCELQMLATEYGVEPLRLAGEVIQHRPDHSHPFVVLDNNKCILCGKCVAICRDLVGPAALGFVNRGFETVMKPTLGLPLMESPCIGCGNCIDQCPTGALMDHLRYRKLREWRVKYVDTVCAHCGVVCDMRYVSVVDGLSWVQTPEAAAEPGDGQLCRTGRFGHRYLSDQERLRTPMIREDGALRQATWDEALGRAVAVLKTNGKESSKAAVIGSGILSMEEAYLLQKVGREGLSTAFVASGSQLLGASHDTSLDRLLGFTGSTVSLDAIDQAELIIIMGADPAAETPVVDFRIHRAKERGAHVLLIGPGSESQGTAPTLRVETKTPGPVMGALLRRLVLGGAVDREFLRTRCTGSDRFEYYLKSASDRDLLAGTGVTPKQVDEAAELIREATGGVIAVVDASAAHAEDVRALAVLMLSLGKLGVEGSGLVQLRAQANEQGLVFVGLHPSFLPGRKQGAGSSVEAMHQAIAEGGVRAALIVGEDMRSVAPGAALVDKIPGCVVLDTFLSKTAQAAEVVLPISAPGETNGRFVNLERRVRKGSPMADPPEGKETWEVLSLLLTRLNGSRMPSSYGEIVSELDDADVFAGLLCTGEDGSPNALFLDGFLTENGLAPLERPTVATKTETQGPSREVSTIGGWIARFMAEAPTHRPCEL